MGNDKALHLVIERSGRPVSSDERATLLENSAFGRVFTDHMATIRYTEGRGWHDAKVQPREAFNLAPDACASLRPGDLRGNEGLSPS